MRFRHLRFSARLALDDNLDWRIKPIKQPAKCIDPAKTVSVGCAGEAECVRLQND